VAAGAPQTPVEMPSRAATTDTDEAAQLLTAGQAEAAVGQYARARDLLERAYALDPQPATLLQLAELEHRTGRCREARLATQRVIAAAPDGPLVDDARQLLDTIGRCD
jgi:tetratricopeptide (TPR) repeat protein